MSTVPNVSTGKNLEESQRVAQLNIETTANAPKENLPVVTFDQADQDNQVKFDAPVRKLVPDYVPTERTSSASFKAPSTVKKNWYEVEKTSVPPAGITAKPLREKFPVTRFDQAADDNQLNFEPIHRKTTPDYVPTERTSTASYKAPVTGKKYLQEVEKAGVGNTVTAAKTTKRKKNIPEGGKPVEPSKLVAPKGIKVKKPVPLQEVEKVTEPSAEAAVKATKEKLPVVKSDQVVENKQEISESPGRKLTSDYVPTERTSTASFKAPSSGKKKPKVPEPSSATTLSTALDYISSPVRYFTSVFSPAPNEPEKPKPKPKSNLLVPPTKKKIATMADTPSPETIAAQATGENLAEVLNSAQNIDQIADPSQDSLMKEKKPDTAQIVPIKEKKYDPLQHVPVKEKKYELVQSVTSRDKKALQKAADIKKASDPKRSRSHSIKKDAKPYNNFAGRNYSGDSKRQSVSPPLKILSANSVKITTSTNMSYRVTSIDREENQQKSKKDARKIFKYDRSPNNSTKIQLSPSKPAKHDEMSFPNFSSASSQKFSLSYLDKSNSANTETDHHSTLRFQSNTDRVNRSSVTDTPTILDTKTFSTDLPTKVDPADKAQGNNVQDEEIPSTNQSVAHKSRELEISKQQQKQMGKSPVSASSPRQQNSRQTAHSPPTVKPKSLSRKKSASPSHATETTRKNSPPRNRKVSSSPPSQKTKSAFSPPSSVGASPKTGQTKFRPNSPVACIVGKSAPVPPQKKEPEAEESNVSKPVIRKMDAVVSTPEPEKKHNKPSRSPWFFEMEKRSLSQIKKEEYMGIQNSLNQISPDSPVIATYNEVIMSPNSGKKNAVYPVETFADPSCFAPTATILGEFP